MYTEINTEEVVNNSNQPSQTEKLNETELLKELRKLTRVEEKIFNKIDVIDPKTGKYFDLEPYEGTWIENIVNGYVQEGRIQMIDDIREIIETIKN